MIEKSSTIGGCVVINSGDLHPTRKEKSTASPFKVIPLSGEMSRSDKRVAVVLRRGGERSEPEGLIDTAN